MTNWKRTIKGIRTQINKAENYEISLQDSLAEISSILKKQPEYLEDDYDSELWTLVDETEYASTTDYVTEDHYNILLNEIYDWADSEKIWIDLDE